MDCSRLQIRWVFLKSCLQIFIAFVEVFVFERDPRQPVQGRQEVGGLLENIFKDLFGLVGIFPGNIEIRQLQMRGGDFRDQLGGGLVFLLRLREVFLGEGQIAQGKMGFREIGSLEGIEKIVFRVRKVPLPGIQLAESQLDLWQLRRDRAAGISAVKPHPRSPPALPQAQTKASAHPGAEGPSPG